MLDREKDLFIEGPSNALKMKMFSILLSIVLISNVIYPADALTCNSCNTITYPDQTCDQTKSCQSSAKSCFKTELEKDDKTYIIKGCNERQNEIADTCYEVEYKEGTATGQGIHCLCSKDECNSAKSITLSVAITVGVATFLKTVAA